MKFPKIYLEITNVCNLSCTFCKGTERGKAFLSVPDFRRYAAAVRPYTDYLYLHVMGEPLLHPELENILDAHRLVAMSCVIGIPDPIKIQKVK